MTQGSKSERVYHWGEERKKYSIIVFGNISFTDCWKCLDALLNTDFLVSRFYRYVKFVLTNQKERNVVLVKVPINGEKC